MKILKRTILIFLIGMGIGWFSRFCYYWTSPTEGIGFGAQLWEAAWTFDRIRILGVMQRLALCYGATAIIALTMKHRNIPYLIDYPTDRLLHPVGLWQWICLQRYERPFCCRPCHPYPRTYVQG